MRSDLFIRRPVLTTLLMAAFVLAGIGAYRALPVSDLPNVDFPTIQVSASLPGASPETMASAVATPLERQFTTIAGIDSMTSTSALGLTQITVQFNLGRDIDGAAQDVQAAIAKAANLLPKFREVLPAQLDLEVLFDRATGIRHSVEDVEFTLLLTIALVVMVIFLFLRNLSATLIPSLAVPSSILGTFALMWALGYSIDLLSLMTLTLCVGFVVDDAVVVLENIVRHMEEGMPRMEAALKGTKEIAFTVISMTISLAAVFIPVLFMGGIVGRLLHEFAVVIAAAVTVSGIVSLTLTPMLCSRFLTPPTHDHGWAYRVIERFFDGLLHVYDVTLRFTLRHKWIADVSLIASLVATVHLFGIIPKGGHSLLCGALRASA